MFNGSNCVRKSQLSGILKEPLNPRLRGPQKALPNFREVSAWEIAQLGSCHLGSCHVGSRP